MVEEFEETKEVPIKWLSEVNQRSIDLVGEKAAFLGEIHSNNLVSKKFIIPEAFILTKKAISDFFTKNNIQNSIKNIFSSVNWENEESLQNASKQIQSLILKSDFSNEIQEEIYDSYLTLSSTKEDLESVLAKTIISEGEPSFVAVRASFINDLGESYFNIKGKSNLIYSIKRCIASFFNINSLIEEKSLGISQELIRPAIIIQKMVESDKSGQIISKNDITIKAIWGMGGGLKIKEITPDEYILRRDFRILDKKINKKDFAVTRASDGSLKLVKLKEGYSFSPVLEEFEMQNLCDLTLRIDDIFSKKMQFDFAFSDESIYIVKIENQKSSQKTEKEELKEEINNEISNEIKKIEKPLEKKIKIEINDILPIKGITKTKIDVLIRNEIEKEEAKFTKIDKGIIFLEEIIKQAGFHPNHYLDNFNTKEYGDLIFSNIVNLSENLKEVWIRLSDFNSDEFSNLEGAPKEIERNPLLGLCGIRYLLSKPELLKRELKAITDLSKNKTVGILIPKITSVYELKKIKNLLDGLESKVKIGIILETPASIQLIKDFLEEGLDSVAFFSDSLTNYLLCLDPKNPQIKDLYDDTSPALMYQIEYVIRVCKRRGVQTKFLGNALSKKEMIDYLVKKEIDSVITIPKKIHNLSGFLLDSEKEFIIGTDKEMRNYEINKEKERQKKELNSFEKIKEATIKKEIEEIYNKEKPIEKIDEKRKTEITNDLPLEEAIKKIREEKEEYENKNIKSKEYENNVEKEMESEELTEDEIFETNQEDIIELKKHDAEYFDEEIEDLEEADLYVEGEEAKKILEEEKKALLNQ